MTWNLQELRGLIEAVHGTGQAELASPSIDGIVARQNLARYHFAEARKFIREALKDRSDSDVMGVFVIGVGEAADLKAAHEAKFQAWAHTVACMQSIHASLDPLSHVVCHGLALRVQRARGISIRNVRKLILDAPLKACFDALIDEPDSIYLEDSVNRAKHRAVFPVSFNADATGTRVPAYGMSLPAFEHHDRCYAQRLVDEALPAIFNRHSRLIVDAGMRLNELLR